jgi:hypothetical protein
MLAEMSRRPAALGPWEVWRRRLWPDRLAPLTPWLLLAPALLLTGSLAIALVVIGESSLHMLDRATFRLADAYSAGNYGSWRSARSIFASSPRPRSQH